MTNAGVALSIVIATYNREKQLRELLQGLLPQVADRPVEIIVVDDRSSDETWAWLQHVAPITSALRCMQTTENGGPGPARNLGLAVARGQYFLPIDSDFLVLGGAIDRILEAIRNETEYRLLFFPCVQYPAMCRLDRLSGRREISRTSFLTEEVGELIPVVDMRYLKVRNLSYPTFRAGGEGLLWAQILEHGPALFLDAPIVFYRTDVQQRICTLEYQMRNPQALAEVADALLDLFPYGSTGPLKAARSRKLVASGTYHVLAGNGRKGRRRLMSAAAEGNLTAVAVLGASLVGRRFVRGLFRFYRRRLQDAYLG